MIKVHITDKHGMLIDELNSAIVDQTVISISGVSNTLKDCSEKLKAQIPDVLVVALNMPDGKGTDFCTKVRQKYPNLKVLILTEYSEYFIIKHAMNNGAAGCILRNSLPEEIIEAISAVMDGKDIQNKHVDIPIHKHEQKDQFQKPSWLNPREEVILKFIEKGYTDDEIAQELHLPADIINYYREMIVKKLFMDNYSNLEIADKLRLPIDVVRFLRLYVVMKIAEKNSMKWLINTKTEEIKLSERDRIILQLLSEGYSNKEIKVKFENEYPEFPNYTEESIKTYHKDLIHKKFKTKCTMTMIQQAILMGIVKIKFPEEFLSQNGLSSFFRD